MRGQICGGQSFPSARPTWLGDQGRAKSALNAAGPWWPYEICVDVHARPLGPEAAIVALWHQAPVPRRTVRKERDLLAQAPKRRVFLGKLGRKRPALTERMRGAELAPILARMDPAKAQAITVEFTKRRRPSAPGGPRVAATARALNPNLTDPS